MEWKLQEDGTVYVYEDKKRLRYNNVVKSFTCKPKENFKFEKDCGKCKVFEVAHLHFTFTDGIHKSKNYCNGWQKRGRREKSIKYWSENGLSRNLVTLYITSVTLYNLDNGYSFGLMDDEQLIIDNRDKFECVFNSRFYYHVKP